MSYLDWKVGDRVVCVDAGPHQGRETPLVEGRVYEVDAIVVWHGDVGIVIAGCQSWHHTRAWQAKHFRKIQPRKTDISVFTAILNGHRVSEDA